MARIVPVSFVSKAAGSQELEVTTRSALFKRGDPKLLAEPSRPDFHVIIHITRGGGDHFVDLITYPLRTGDTIFIAAGQVQQFDTRSDMEFIAIFFTESFLLEHGARSIALADDRLFNYQLFTPVVPGSSMQKEDLPQLFELLHSEYKGTGERKGEVLHHLLEAVLIKTARGKGTPADLAMSARTYKDFIRLKNHVEANYCRTHRAQDYADLMGRSLKSLNALCKQLTGKTVKEYVDDRIILEIRRHMSLRDLSIKEIGYAMGFDEPTNMVKFVRRLTGSTPGELAR